ncbi:ATP-binding region ATPase domain protein (plasmid) [Gemmatirosa kalamazoonensis]|uniref:histidine kinase n=1 Tax=Gemmatirosa kalamazoonensis TaxID=861299 RepID=W0RPQ1_9BACT|nr:ATP-binding protein [Gemmatirosa kalamazoonensis]AHG92984.1 ATP-binding region ATPase domain protein [Gemmatirosa kalamazoonensis]
MTAPGGWRGLLRVPLLQKLVVADLLINILAFVVMRNARAQYADEIMVVALLVTLVLNAGMVYWALLPLRALELTADRVARGDLSVRVPPSRLADRNVARIGHTFNRVLDGLVADRARVRTLAAQVIRAGDEERAHIARELHDSTAQQLSALEMLVTATMNETAEADAAEADAAESAPPPHPLPPVPIPHYPIPRVLGGRLRVMHGIVTEALREVRTLSHTVHPRVLDDLGLAAALETLARRTQDQSGVAVHVTASGDSPPSAPVASVLYRVAQEALRNALRHAGASRIDLRLEADARATRLTVADDGVGFDVAATDAARAGLGLFVMRERLALVDGTLTIDSGRGVGTRVIACAPSDAADA